MATEGRLHLGHDLTVLLFHLSLLLDDTHELITLCFSLLSEHYLAFDELPAASNVEVFGLLTCIFSLFFLIPSESALVFFKSSLSS